MIVHVYRNRPDDRRTRTDLHFCHACGGWYGVPHAMSHCQTQGIAGRPGQCACRFCCEADGRPIQGRYGLVTKAKAWQP